MALGTRRTPERRSPLFSSPPIPKRDVSTITVTSGTTPLTCTTTQLLKGLLPVDCQDTGTLTLPTATLIAAAVPGIEVGSCIDFTIINFGDTNLTLAVGTGITAKVITTKTTALTIATLQSDRFWLVCTALDGVSGSVTNTFDLYGSGPTAAAAAG